MKIIPGRKLVPASSIYREIDRFIRILGIQNCKNKIADLDEQLKDEDRVIYNNNYLKLKNPLLNELREYFDLQKMGKSITKKRSSAMNNLFSKAVTINMMASSLSKEGKEQLKNNLINDEVRPFLFEIQIITHFLQNNYSIEYNDLDSLSLVNKNFEFTVKKPDFVGEVECKWKDINAGSKIEREKFYTLVDIIFNNLKLEKGSFKIKIGFENRLKIEEKDIGQLGIDVAKSIIAGDKTYERYDRLKFEFSILPNILSAEDAEQLTIDSQTGKGHYAAIGNEKFSLYIIAESDTDDNIINSIHRTLKSAEKQLSQKYPALIALYLQDIHPDQFEILRTQSNLANLATKYFKSESRSFIHTISFTSYESILKDDSNTYMQSPAVSWRNPNCKFETPQNPFQLNDDLQT